MSERQHVRVLGSSRFPRVPVGFGLVGGDAEGGEHPCPPLGFVVGQRAGGALETHTHGGNMDSYVTDHSFVVPAPQGRTVSTMALKRCAACGATASQHVRAELVAQWSA